MNCQELAPDYTSYALGVADDPERTEISQHLADQCPQCVPGVASAMATVTALSGGVKIVDPPPFLRRRVMQLVKPEPSKLRLGAILPWLLTAAVSAALLYIGINGRRQVGDTAKLQQALAILNDPATRDVTFGETQRPSRGRVFVSAGKGLVFIGANLPSIDSSKTFELWVIPKAGNPIPAGLFQSQTDASAVVVRPGPIENAAAIAVSVEPSGGSAQPTTTPFIVTKL